MSTTSRPCGAELLFQVLTEREDRPAIVIASNEPVLPLDNDLRRPATLRSPARRRSSSLRHFMGVDGYDLARFAFLLSDDDGEQTLRHRSGPLSRGTGPYSTPCGQ